MDGFRTDVKRKRSKPEPLRHERENEDFSYLEEKHYYGEAEGQKHMWTAEEFFLFN